MDNPPKVCSATPWEVSFIQSIIARHVASKKRGQQVYVEVGSYMGGSLRTYGGCMPKGSILVAVDQPHNEQIADNLIRVSAAMSADGYDSYTVIGNNHAQEIANQTRDLLEGKKADVLFVDGDHTPEGCEMDLDLYGPLVRPGGLVLMHDCGFSKGSKPLAPANVPIIAGLHDVWERRSAYKRRFIIQDWAGYGGWWT